MAKAMQMLQLETTPTMQESDDNPLISALKDFDAENFIKLLKSGSDANLQFITRRPGYQGDYRLVEYTPLVYILDKLDQVCELNLNEYNKPCIEMLGALMDCGVNPNIRCGNQGSYTRFNSVIDMIYYSHLNQQTFSPIIIKLVTHGLNFLVHFDDTKDNCFHKSAMYLNHSNIDWILGLPGVKESLGEPGINSVNLNEETPLDTLFSQLHQHDNESNLLKTVKVLVGHGAIPTIEYGLCLEKVGKSHLIADVTAILVENGLQNKTVVTKSRKVKL